MVNSAPDRDSGRKLFFGLFIFPLLIAVTMAVLLCTVVLLTREVETPESLITAIKSGTPSKRWQKAFELSNELNQGRGLIRESGVMKEIIHILNSRSEYDAKTRAYTAIALSRFEDSEAVQALQTALRDETEPDVQLHLIWALGVRQSKDSADQVAGFLSHESEDIRKTAAYVLGVIGGSGHVQRVEALLEDPSKDVRWNSALALARLGSDAGYPTILKMLDRGLLESSEGLTPERVEEVMVNAVKGIALIDRADTVTILKQLSKEDPSLKVRQTALEALGSFKG